MKTEIEIDRERFLMNGRPTYGGVTWNGKPVEGLLMNSRMVQAVFDDECAETRALWSYPDTGVWDPDRNTDGFCAQLPEYRRHGLLAVTVGLQCGGSNYSKAVYDNYVCSAYAPDGSFKEPFFDRLLRVLRAADEAGVVVIVNYFYWKQARRIPDDRTVVSIVERVTERLLQTGFRNVLVDVANESAGWWKRPIFEPENIHRLIDAAKGVTVDGRRLLASASTGGGDALPSGKWLEAEDFSLPHGNGCTPESLAAKLRRLKEDEAFGKRPRPVVVNEDSPSVENMEAAVSEGSSWGYYDQGYGSDYEDRVDWTGHGREREYESLSGFQTLPVNWGINTPRKRAFFERLREITGGK